MGGRVKNLVDGCRMVSVAAALVAALVAAPATAGADWSGAVELTNSAERDGEQLAIDANPAGDLVAAWRENGTADIAAVFKRAATAAGAPQKFTGDFDEPDVAIGPGSVAVLAFDDDSGYGSVYAASKAAAASAFTGTVSFIGDGHSGPSAPPSAAEPRVAVNGFGTGMLFFGRDYYNPPSYTDIAEAIEGRVLLDPNTNSWGTGTDLNTVVKDPREMEVSVGSDGSAFLGINFFSLGPCWGLEPALLQNDGTGSADPANLTESCSDVYRGVYPSNDRLPNNDVVMAWGHSGDGSVRFLDLPKARALGGGAAQDQEDDEVRLDAGDDSQTTSGAVRVRTDAAGNTIVVWHASGGAEEAILARVRPAGGSFGPVEVIDSGGDYMAEPGELDFDVDDAGSGYLVYSQANETSGDDEIMAAVRRPDGAWSSPKLLSAGQSVAGSPAVAASGGGRAYAAWIADGDDGVYYSTFQAPACADTVDNDGDGLVDYPADPDCSSPSDDDESSPPATGTQPAAGTQPATDNPPAAANPPAAGSSNGGTASIACIKAGSGLAKASRRVAKANRQLRRARAKVRKANKQVRKNRGGKAKKQLRRARASAKQAKRKAKRLEQQRRRAGMAKRGACS
jgi:hypothetical protein